MLLGIVWLLLQLACVALTSGDGLLVSPVYHMLGLSISKSTRYIRRDPPAAKFDEYGLPQLENTNKAIEQAKQIVVVRAKNATVVAYQADKTNTLQVPIGVQRFHSLISPYRQILLTGMVGDCRAVVRFAKQMVLNYTVEFDGFPEVKYIADKLGEFLIRKAAEGGSRHLACHIFLIGSDRGQPGVLFEVSPAGTVSQILGGTAGGRRTQTSRSLLADRFSLSRSNVQGPGKNIHSTFSVENAVGLCREVLYGKKLLPASSKDSALPNIQYHVILDYDPPID